jgi:hypothetical protein
MVAAPRGTPVGRVTLAAEALVGSTDICAGVGKGAAGTGTLLTARGLSVLLLLLPEKRLVVALKN